MERIDKELECAKTYNKEFWGDYENLLDNDLFVEVDKVLKNRCDYCLLEINNTSMYFETIESLKYLLKSFLIAYLDGFNSWSKNITISTNSGTTVAVYEEDFESGIFHWEIEKGE